MQKERGSSRLLSLHQEIEREAREIEKEMKRHPELDDIQVTEEMDAALLKKIQDYEEELAEEQEAVKKVEENLRRGRYLTAADGTADRTGKHGGTDDAVRYFRVPGDSVEFAAELMPEFPRGFGLGGRDIRDSRDGIGETVAGCIGPMTEASAGYGDNIEETIDDGYGKKLKKVVAGYGGSMEGSVTASGVKYAESEFAVEPGDVMEDAGEDSGERKVLYRRKKRKYILISLAAVLVIVVGVGGTSVGSKSHWKVLWERVTGGESMKVINTEDMDSYETEDVDEVAVYNEITEKLNIDPVRIIYKPDNMKLIDYEIQEEILRAELLYKYKDEIIRYFLYMNDLDSSIGQNEEDEQIDEYIIYPNDVEIKVDEFKKPEYSKNRQEASFEYQGVHYQLKGVMEREEFEKILRNLYFFEK